MLPPELAPYRDQLPADLVAELEARHRELVLERELARRREADPLAHMAWLPAQLAFLRCDAREKVLRTGNQSQGKTTAGGADALWWALGTHPYVRTPPPPTYQWAICASERQSMTVQRKVWELVPKDEVAAGCFFDPRKGAFRGKYPTLRFRNGSWIKFLTGGGDTASLASETLHRVWIDEPPESERVYNEVKKRVLRMNGKVAITMTPVNRPTKWLQERVAKGLIEDLWYDLRPEHLILSDGSVMRLADGTPMDADWIARVIAETSEVEVPVVVHGDWEFRAAGAYFGKVWDPRMVREAPPGDYEELLGIDFGSQPGKQIIAYILVNETGGPDGGPYVHVEDLYVGETGRETVEDDARGALDLLERQGSAWSDLRDAVSDRVHKAGMLGAKSASDLEDALAAELGISVDELQPRVRVAKRGRGRGRDSAWTRARWLHGRMARGAFSVHPRCKRLIDAIPQYHPKVDDDHKDPVDAVVYGVDEWIFGAPARTRLPVRAW